MNHPTEYPVSLKLLKEHIYHLSGSAEYHAALRVFQNQDPFQQVVFLFLVRAVYRLGDRGLLFLCIRLRGNHDGVRHILIHQEPHLLIQCS